jgi:methyl-accepting chemotaxis protein
MFHNLKISTKITLGFVTIILFTIILGVSSIYNMRILSDFTTSFYSSPYTVTQAALETKADIIAMHRSMKDVALAQNAAQVETARSQVDKLEQQVYQNFEIINKRFLGDKILIDNEQKAIKDWKPIRDEVIELSLAGNKEEAASITREQGAKQEQLIESSIDQIVDFAKSKAGAFNSNASDVENQIFKIIVGLIIAAILISAVIAYLIIRGVSRSLHILNKEITALAEKGGDLTQQIRVESKDEIGDLASAVNNFIAELRNIMRNVLTSAEQVAASSQQLTASSSQSTEAANQVTSAILQVANGAEKQVKSVGETSNVITQMSLNVNQMADKTGLVAATADKTATAAVEGGHLIDKAINQMSNISATVTNASQVVTRLGDRSKEIGQIVETISGIASQTNLLALNAAIEAARAGEQGRGFAVVAEEVRKLAEQSQEAAQQITILIRDIQTDTEKSVIAMNDGTREVKIGNEVVLTAGQAFKEIIEFVDHVSSQVCDISRTIEQVSESSRQIEGSVSEIQRISSETAAETETVSAATEEQLATIEEIAAASQALAQLAESLQVMVNKFKV